MHIFPLHNPFCSCNENFVAFETKLNELLHFHFLNLDMSQRVYFLPIGPKTMFVQMPLIILLFGLGSWYCTYSPSILSSSLLCFIFKKYQTRYILRERAINRTGEASHIENPLLKTPRSLYTKKVIRWFELNHMKVNTSKFQCMVFGKTEGLGDFVVNENIICPTDEVTLLGITVDSKLNFNSHVSNICIKAGKQVQVLSRLCNVLNRQHKLLLYNSFIECYFNYCSIVWHFGNISNLKKVEKLQERALRYITLDFRNSYMKLMELCDKSPVYIVRLRKMMEVVFKILNNSAPIYLSDIVNLKPNDRNLRCSYSIKIPTFHTMTYGKKSLTYFAGVIWNNLDNDIKCAETFKMFKSKLSAWSGPKCLCGSCFTCAMRLW